MRIPVFILEHPVEGLIAGILLLVLLVGSADRHAAEGAKTGPHSGTQIVAAGKM